MDAAVTGAAINSQVGNFIVAPFASRFNMMDFKEPRVIAARGLAPVPG